jgi:hypothetical protein
LIIVFLYYIKLGVFEIAWTFVNIIIKKIEKITKTEVRNYPRSKNSKNLVNSGMDKQRYRMVCTLSFSDIYGQIVIWLLVIFLSLASALSLWSTTRQIYALATVGLILVLSLPFLLFAFVTTLLNHIEFVALEVDETTSSSSQKQHKFKKAEPATI